MSYEVYIPTKTPTPDNASRCFSCGDLADTSLRCAATDPLAKLPYFYRPLCRQCKVAATQGKPEVEA